MDTARVEEVVGDFVDLKKRGTSLIGLCPFHDEKTPSFHVSISKGIFKCFGCGKGGDSVRFIMELEKYSFPEAIRYLAEKYHIEIEEVERSPEEIQKQDKRESFFILNQWAEKFFANQIWNTAEGKTVGLSYFIERGLREATIKKFNLGYAPSGWTTFCEEAEKAGFSRELLSEIGLGIKRNDGSLYDRYRERVIFPIHSLTGRVLGFGGRTLKSDKKTPKYVNSSDSEVYNKSEVLYGLHQARKEIANIDEAYLVEGYLDVLALHQAGVEQAVATSGTALTQRQVRLIKRYTSQVSLLFDGDDAGIQAANRGARILLEEGMHVRVLLFPKGHDPDSYIKEHGKTGFEKLVEEKREDFIHFRVRSLVEQAGDDPLKKTTGIREIMEDIALIPDEIKVSFYIKHCSTALGIEERIVLAELNKIRIQKSKKRQAQASASEQRRVQEPFEEPPPDLLADPQDAIAAAASGHHPLSEKKELDTHRVKLEREVIRVLLHYGDRLTEWEEKPSKIAPYILWNLRSIEFLDPPSLKVINIFKEQAQKQVVPSAKEFISSEDQEIAALAVDCMAEKYELSPNWNDDKRKIYITKEEEKLKDVVLQCVFRLQKKSVQMDMEELTKQLKDEKDEQSVQFLLSKYQLLKQAEKTLGNFLGNIITK